MRVPLPGRSLQSLNGILVKGTRPSGGKMGVKEGGIDGNVLAHTTNRHAGRTEENGVGRLRESMRRRLATFTEG
jgi:hypothetical protein